MHFLKRWMFAILPLILAATACAQQPPETEVLWDTYGVPHVYGKSLAGMYYGFGWAQMHNHANLLLLKDSNTYILDNKPVRFLQKSVTLKVKQENGSLQSQTIPLRYSKQGPVIMGKNGEAYAVRIAGIERPDMMYQWHQMGAAQNWAQFEAALKLMQLPMFNVMYADDAGNINYLFAGNVPVRAQGNWDFWQQPVDGSKSTYIWQQTHPYKDLPKLHNPSTGFLQNANDPPWTCTYPTVLDPAGYPSYMASRNTGLRPQRALNMIRKDSSITYEELTADKYNTGMEAADRYLDELLAAVKQYPDTAATRAAAVLQQWDRATDSASTGALLFIHWFDKLSPGMVRTPFDPAHPVTTPAGLKDPAGAVKLLAAAAAEVQQQYGRLDVPWGSQVRMRFNKRNYAGNGGSGHYGIFRVIDYREDEDKKYTASGGDSYVAIVEFSKPLKAQVLLSYGNATQPGNKHLGDQLQLLSQKKLRTPWLQRSEVMEHLEERETP